MTRSADDEREVTAVLVHLKKLLRVRNQLCSPLLQLPTETIVRILSFVMTVLDFHLYTDAWKPIYGTCHRIHEIMRGATELWWWVDYAQPWMAHFLLVRSKGNPQVITSDLRFMEMPYTTVRILDHWREQGFRGHSLHTFEFLGPRSSFGHFSWILERCLHRVRHLRIHVTNRPGEGGPEFGLSDPVALELPMDMPLQVLDLLNVTPSWLSLSHLPNGLHELRLDFKDCNPAVIISEDELFGVLDASPRLEHLSLVQVGHEVPGRNGEPLPPKRTLQFPNLSSLTLDNDPMVIKYTLAYMDLPVVTSLSICSFISREIARTLKTRLFPDDHLLARLSSNPSIFAVRVVGLDDPDNSIEVDIGSIKLGFNFPLDGHENCIEAFMTFIPSLAPPSVTTLKLEYTQLTEQEWRDFFTLHPEVRSVEFGGYHVSRTLWDALSPAGEDTDILCPRLESVSITLFTRNVTLTALSDCLRNRQTAGFKLRHLKVLDSHVNMGGMDMLYERFGPLVEVIKADGDSKLTQRVSFVSHEVGWYSMVSSGDILKCDGRTIKSRVPM